MKTTVAWYGGCRGSWCHAVVEWLTADCIHTTDHMQLLACEDPCVVVIKADQVKDWERFNKAIAGIHAVLLIVTANEDGTFMPEIVKHPRMRMWIQTPTIAQNHFASVALPWGWTPGFDGTRWLADLPGYTLETSRKLAFSFAGQVTHWRRSECVRALNDFEAKGLRGCIIGTQGFAKGLPRELYFELLLMSRAVPCPSGPITKDSFRVCEALEAGCVPILDNLAPGDSWDRIDKEYWNVLFGYGHPLPMVTHWDEAEYKIRTISDNWNAVQATTLDWWNGRKRYWREKFQIDLEALKRTA